MSITEQDIKALKQGTSKRFRVITLIVMPLTIIILLCVGILNFLLCYRFATMAGLSVSQVFEKWIEGIDLSQQYSGVLIMALQRLQTGLTQIILAIFFVFLLWAQQSITKRNARILKFIEEKNLTRRST